MRDTVPFAHALNKPLGIKRFSTAGPTMPGPQAPLPKFKKPPVIETALGVQFARLRSFSIPHFGLFWSRIRSDYPNQELQPPLGPVIETFGGAPSPAQLNIMFVTEPEARCLFIDATGTQLIQVQRDRFLRNWRRAKGSEPYPSYEYLRPRFETDWGRYLGFLADERIEDPEINQCEVTYVNHVEATIDSLGDASRMLRGVAALSGEFLPDPETVHLNTRYVMGDKKGRLTVDLQPAVRLDDRRPVLQLTLTARGTPGSSRLEDILAWFDFGHEWIVRGFADFTRPEMHTQWERTQ